MTYVLMSCLFFAEEILYNELVTKPTNHMMTHMT